MGCLERRTDDDPGLGLTSSERARNVGFILLAIVLIALISHIIVRYWIKPSVLPPCRPTTPQPREVEFVGQLPGARLTALRSQRRPKRIRLDPYEVDVVAPVLQITVRPTDNKSTTFTVLRAPSPTMFPLAEAKRYPRKPTSQGTIDAIPSSPLGHPSSTTVLGLVYLPQPPPPRVIDHSECSICLEVFKDYDLVRETLCSHIFHKRCLEWWLTKHWSRCPLCQNDFKPNGILCSPTEASVPASHESCEKELQQTQ
ncbi:hypothetical protein GGS26DRAFT_253818 [Hypomontagnella submonticulosa]|nr:hypothetical protein GGS26DRAFT_253818 [Hypomontagnella submonticulosa]